MMPFWAHTPNGECGLPIEALCELCVRVQQSIWNKNQDRSAQDKRPYERRR